MNGFDIPGQALEARGVASSHPLGGLPLTVRSLHSLGRVISKLSPFRSLRLGMNGFDIPGQALEARGVASSHPQGGLSLTVRSLMLLVLACAFLSPLPGAANDKSTEIHVFTDAWAIDSVWMGHTGIRLGIGVSHPDGIGVELPVSLLVDRTGGGEILLDLALKLVCHPWGTGPFVAISMAQACFFIGHYIPQDSVHYLNEIEFGYTWNCLPGWFLRPSVIYRDPSNGFPESYTYVQALIPAFGKFQFCLNVGWNFASIAASEAVDDV